MFLQSTNDLVELRLLNIPRDGYISPGMLVTGLATLSKLEYLSISFESRNLPPMQGLTGHLSLIVLHSLTRFLFVSRVFGGTRGPN